MGFSILMFASTNQSLTELTQHKKLLNFKGTQCSIAFICLIAPKSSPKVSTLTGLNSQCCIIVFTLSSKENILFSSTKTDYVSCLQSLKFESFLTARITTLKGKFLSVGKENFVTFSFSSLECFFTCSFLSSSSIVLPM